MTLNNSGIVINNLITNFDLSDLRCYNPLLPNQIISNIKYPKSTLSNIILDDFGLNMYDIGRVILMSGVTQLYNHNDNKLILYKNAINDSSGNTTVYPITFFSSGTIGYMSLIGNNGYLNNFFKLEDYNYELLPYRYANGVTFETWVYTNNLTYSSITLNNNNGFFLYMGVRSENKFNMFYSGDSGYTTSTNISLNPNNDDFNINNSIYDNNIGFKFNEYGQIGYRFISISGETIENYTTNIIPTGWTQIAIVFKSCGDSYVNTSVNNIGMSDQNLRFGIPLWSESIDCLDRRDGSLMIYVNGKLFETFNDFPEEFWFKGFDGIDKTKQIGVPYNISWGGGTNGLKYNWHFNSSGTTYNYEHNFDQNNLLVESNFDGSFYGYLSILRIYDDALSSVDIKQNYNAIANNFGLHKLQGGRVIYI